MRPSPHRHAHAQLDPLVGAAGGYDFAVQTPVSKLKCGIWSRSDSTAIKNREQGELPLQAGASGRQARQHSQIIHEARFVTPSRSINSNDLHSAIIASRRAFQAQVVIRRRISFLLKMHDTEVVSYPCTRRNLLRCEETALPACWVSCSRNSLDGDSRQSARLHVSWTWRAVGLDEGFR